MSEAIRYVLIFVVVMCTMSAMVGLVNATYSRPTKKNPEQAMRQAYHVASQEKFKSEQLLIDRCDQQCKWLMEGDVRGIYGEYPPHSLDTLDPIYALVVKPSGPDPMTVMEKSLAQVNDYAKNLKQELFAAQKSLADAEARLKRELQAQKLEQVVLKAQIEADGWFNCKYCQEYTDEGVTLPSGMKMCPVCAKNPQRKNYYAKNRKPRARGMFADFGGVENCLFTKDEQLTQIERQIAALEQTPPAQMGFTYLEPVLHFDDLPVDDVPNHSMISVLMPPKTYLWQSGKWYEVASPAQTCPTPAGGFRFDKPWDM